MNEIIVGGCIAILVLLILIFRNYQKTNELEDKIDLLENHIYVKVPRFNGYV